MSHINITKCDADGCENTVDNGAWDRATFHNITFGGSDFEMSFGGQRGFDFCSIPCMQSFLTEFEEDIKKEQAIEKA